MIEQALMQYGVLGVWTLTLLYERFNYNKTMKSLIENNTIALVQVKDNIIKCKRHAK